MSRTDMDQRTAVERKVLVTPAVAALLDVLPRPTLTGLTARTALGGHIEITTLPDPPPYLPAD